MISVVICLNCLIALCVFWLASGLWQWRCRLALWAQQLEQREGEFRLRSQQARYGLTYRRVQIAQTQLAVATQLARWQQRSRQIRAIQQLIRLFQLVSLLRRR